MTENEVKPQLSERGRERKEREDGEKRRGRRECAERKRVRREGSVGLG